MWSGIVLIKKRTFFLRWSCDVNLIKHVIICVTVDDLIGFQILFIGDSTTILPNTYQNLLVWELSFRSVAGRLTKLIPSKFSVCIVVINPVFTSSNHPMVTWLLTIHHQQFLICLLPEDKSAAVSLHEVPRAGQIYTFQSILVWWTLNCVPACNTFIILE